MAQYLLSVWHDGPYELDFSTPDAQRRMAQVGHSNTDLEAAGALVFACGLQPSSSASVVRPAEEGVSIRAGAFASGSEEMGGFWIIEVEDNDAAQAWATRGSIACEGPVELRPLQG
jgi:hypothetical protein